MFSFQTSDFGLGPSQWMQSDHTGCGQDLHFLAANGFPVGSYQFFLSDFLKDFRIYALENRGVWDPNPKPRFTWPRHADDLITFLDYQKSQGAITAPVIGVGHSIGGTVTAIAAVKRPDLFSHVIMVDPATTPGWLLPIADWVMPSAYKAQRPLVESTRKRRNRWESREIFVRFLKRKSVYRNFQDKAFLEYANAGLKEEEGGAFVLAYNREWEAINFEHTYALWRIVKRIKVPTLLLRAEHSSLHPLNEFSRQTRRLPKHIEFDTLRNRGHLAIQENGRQVSERIFRWLTA